jgi:L,D-peptidoglycan transpeptidase YkuD (ErfK/YbiS/YcfS/YnhG family)
MFMSLLRRVSLSFILLLIFTFVFNETFVNASSFPDVNQSYKGEIDYLVEKEIILGFDDGTFGAEKPVRRADAVAMIGRSLGFSGEEQETPFPDLGKGNHASGYIVEAVNQGIIQGFPNGTFRPDSYLTRGQMSMILDRAFPELEAISDTNFTFSDLGSGNTAYDSIQKIASSGISNGYLDHTFRPDREVTRIEMALFLARALDEQFRVEMIEPEPLPLVAKTKVAQETDQIVTVVSTGGGHAKVEYWKKNSGKWQKQMSTDGFVGQEGVSSNKKEGDRKAPTGAFKFPFAFGTENPGTKMTFRQITSRSYWISNVNDPQYNTWQEKNWSPNVDERLSSYPFQYKYAMAIDYNMDSPVPGDGSAIFLHVSNGTPTLGCVSVPESDMRYLMQQLGSNARIIITDKESNLTNY